MTAPLLLGTNSIKDSSYDVANSVRMDIGSSDHFERTPSSAVTGERKKFTVSCWVKRSVLGGEQAIISAGNGAGSEEFEIVFTNDNTLQVKHDNASSIVHQLVTKMKFAETASWFHIVYVYDSANATEALRARLFVNGVELTDADSDFSTYNAVILNDLTPMNVDERHHVGSTSFDSGGSGASFFGGYMAEFYQTAGQANVASVFGEYDSDSPTIWKPKNPSGLSFGTNGFYLDFEDSSNLGKDVSGNTNNFTVDNLTSIDQCTDTCTNNFATFTAENHTASNFTLTEGNLKVRRTTGTSGLHGTSIMPTQGKWYFEVKIGEAGSGDRSRVGVMNYQSQLNNSTYTGVINTPSQVLAGCTTSCKSAKHFEGDGQGVMVEYTSSGDFADGNIVQIAMDLDNKAIYIGRDGTFLTRTGSSGGDPTSGSSKTGAITTNTNIMDGSPMTAYTGLSVGSGTDVSEMFFNFGNPPFSITSGNTDDNGFGNFEHAPPTGYLAWCSKNLGESG
tara:strand:- start:1829 stop:3343 length:1515 start_codon:yes stop_codon:yes gene_type:complete